MPTYDNNDRRFVSRAEELFKAMAQAAIIDQRVGCTGSIPAHPKTSGENPGPSFPDQLTGRVTGLGVQTQNPPQVPEFTQDFVTGFLRGGRDLNTRPDPQPGEVQEHSGQESGHLRLVGGAGELPERVLEQSDCHTVTRELADWVERAIVAMLEEWQARRDERALRGALGRLIAGL